MDPDSNLTSLHVYRARDGEADSLAWLIAHISPLLRIQAAYRLRGSLRRLYDPDDLVGEVWAVALPRLKDLRERESALTPVLFKFLSTTLLNKANRLIEKHLSHPVEALSPSPAESSSTDPWHRFPADVANALTLAERNEDQEALQQALSELPDRDREVLVLRGIEQIENQEVARLLGLAPSTVTRRYQRAILRLRERMPGSVFDELTGE